MNRVSLPIALVLSAVIIAGAAGLLYWFGRPPICPCGFVKLVWYGAKGAPEESQHLFDIYGVTHVLHGMLFYLLIWLGFRLAGAQVPLLAGLVIAVALEAGWELFENSNFMIRRYQDAGAIYIGDSVINSVGDILAMAIGFLIAGLVPVWATVALFVGAEVGLALLIRDNLILNIISLIRPIEWIQKWQDTGSSR